MGEKKKFSSAAQLRLDVHCRGCRHVRSVLKLACWMRWTSDHWRPLRPSGANYRNRVAARHATLVQRQTQRARMIMDTLPELPIVASYTNLNHYITCPKQFNHRYIAKDCPPEVKTGKQNTGIETHDAIKRRFKLREPLPDDMQQHEQACAAILAD